jgi:hypothetical protein
MHYSRKKTVDYGATPVFDIRIHTRKTVERANKLGNRAKGSKFIKTRQ